MANVSADSHSSQHLAEVPSLSLGTPGSLTSSGAEEALRAANEKLHAELERLRADLASQQEALNAQRESVQAEYPTESVVADDATEYEPEVSDDSSPSEDVEEERATPPSAGSAGGHDDEESIESYMAALMNRVRGGDESRAAKPSRRPERRAERVVVEKRTQVETPKREPVAEQPPVIVPPKSPRDLTPRPRMAVTDMAAMRELANAQARMAINTHGRKQLGKLMVVRLAIAAGCLIGAFVALQLWPFELGPLFAIGMAGLVVGIYWMSLAANDLQLFFNWFQTRDGQQGSKPTSSESDGSAS